MVGCVRHDCFALLSLYSLYLWLSVTEAIPMKVLVGTLTELLVTFTTTHGVVGSFNK